MYVYEFVHMSYSWYDNDYSLYASEIFSNYKDALIYFEGAIDATYREYLKEANVSTIEEFEEDDYCYLYAPDLSNEKCKDDIQENRNIHFYISLDEYGSETIELKKKRIMKFS